MCSLVGQSATEMHRRSTGKGGEEVSGYKCPDCGANLDPEEKCDCKKEKGTPPKGESAKEKNKTL